MKSYENVFSLEDYKPNRRWVTSREIHVLFVGECGAQHSKLTEVALRNKTIRLVVDCASTPAEYERLTADRCFGLYIIDQWLADHDIAPIVEACLEDRSTRTVILSDHPEAEEDWLNACYPSALVLSRYDLDSEMLMSLILDDEIASKREPANPAAIDGLLQSTAAIRTTVASICREMMAADGDLDRGETLSGHSHILAAIRRLTDVETALRRMEGALTRRLRFHQVEEQA